jgi:hypothetical protein
MREIACANDSSRNFPRRVTSVVCVYAHRERDADIKLERSRERSRLISIESSFPQRTPKSPMTETTSREQIAAEVESRQQKTKRLDVLLLICAGLGLTLAWTSILVLLGISLLAEVLPG